MVCLSPHLDGRAQALHQAAVDNGWYDRLQAPAPAAPPIPPVATPPPPPGPQRHVTFQDQQPPPASAITHRNRPPREVAIDVDQYTQQTGGAASRTGTSNNTLDQLLELLDENKGRGMAARSQKKYLMELYQRASSGGEGLLSQHLAFALLDGNYNAIMTSDITFEGSFHWLNAYDPFMEQLRRLTMSCGVTGSTLQAVHHLTDFVAAQRVRGTAWNVVRLRVLARFHRYCTLHDPCHLEMAGPGEEDQALMVAAASNPVEQPRPRPNSKPQQGHQRIRDSSPPPTKKARKDSDHQGKQCSFHQAKYKAQNRAGQRMDHALEECQAFKELSAAEQAAFRSSGTLPGKN